MILTRRGRIVRNIAVTLTVVPLALLASLDMDADAAPLPLGEPVQVVQAAAAPPEWRCKDKAAMTLYRAGFTGWAHKQAWAVTWRESRHQNLIPGHPSFNGSDWGMWQINRGAHGGNSWWTEDNMSDPAVQSRIAYKHLSQKATYWRPWGLTKDGQLDATHYGSWGPDLWDAWIMSPFREGLSLYPCKTTPPKAKR